MEESLPVDNRIGQTDGGILHAKGRPSADGYLQ